MLLSVQVIRQLFQSFPVRFFAVPLFQFDNIFLAAVSHHDVQPFFLGNFYFLKIKSFAVNNGEVIGQWSLAIGGRYLSRNPANYEDFLRVIHFSCEEWVMKGKGGITALACRENSHKGTKSQRFTKVPIVRITQEQQHAFVFKVDRMTNFNKELHEHRLNFIQLLQTKWPYLAISGKISEWVNLSFEDFSQELEKQKIKLSLQEQSVWLQYFNEQRQKAATIQSLIVKTDNEIDRMVYALYELTDEEIRIIEQSR